MKTKIINKSKAGFSIIEVLVAVGLLSVVSLALIAVLDSTNKGQKRAMNRDNLLNLTNQIRSSLTDTNLCRQAFVFNVGNSINFPAAPTINTSYALNRVTAFGRDLVTSNAAIPGTLDVATPPTSAATGLRLSIGNSAASATPGFTNWDATLIIPLVVTNQTSMKDLTITFLITTDDTAPTVIASCNAMASGTTDQMVCENIMGGVYDIARTPMCRLQQTFLSPTQYRDELSAIPGGSFLAVETAAGGRGIASFGAGARIGLYITENDFASTPTNGVAFTIPANNQLNIDAAQGITSNGYLHISRGAAGPNYAFRLTNTVSGVDVFNIDRNGRFYANTVQNNAWNNLGASGAVGDILRVYDNGGTTQISVENNGDVAIGPNANNGKLDVRANAAGTVLTWGLGSGAYGTLSASVGTTTLAATGGNSLVVQSPANSTLQSTNNMTLASGTDLSITAADDTTLNSNGTTTLTSAGAFGINTNNTLSLQSTNNMALASGTDLSITAASDTTLNSSGTTTLSSVGALGISTNANLSLSSNASTSLTTSNGLSISTQGGVNTLNFTATDADFSRNINAPTVNNVSDSRLKAEIEKTDSVLDKLIQLQSYSFVFKDDPERIKHFGFLAQEVLHVFPNLVRKNQKGFLTLNYIEVVPLLVEALKETQRKNQALEQRIEDLEKTIKNIESNLRGQEWNKTRSKQ